MFKMNLFVDKKIAHVFCLLKNKTRHAVTLAISGGKNPARKCKLGSILGSIFAGVHQNSILTRELHDVNNSITI